MYIIGINRRKKVVTGGNLSMEKRVWNTYGKLGEESGFGEVFLAKKIVNDIEQPEEYAFKKLVQLDSDSIERFKREVAYLKQLDHPRIIKCEGSNLSKEPYFYTMKKYNMSLTQIQSSLSSDYNRLKLIYNKILEGIEYLHDEGYYHRDLKPGNVLLNNDNDLVLCDLGLCINPLAERGGRLTRTFMAIGSEYYCSPEQKESLKKVDHRTDIYSFGKMVYEAFTGTKPSVLDLNQVPPAIQYVIRKCTEDQRSDRFDSVTSLKRHFNIAMDLLTESESNTDLLELINDLNTYDDLDYILDTTSKVDKLADNLSKYTDDEELHETIMKINSTVIKNLFDKYPVVMNKVLKKFIKHTSSHGWPFSYTDTLANKYQEIFQNISDVEIHEEILKALLEIGVSHNRWFVMGIFVDLLYSVTDESEAYSIYHSLSDEDYYLKKIANNIIVDRKKIHHILSNLFPQD